MTSTTALTDFYLNRLKDLVGGTITGLARTGELDPSGDEYFGLVIKLPDGTVKALTFLADDEGNGPGSFELQAVP